MLTDILGIAIAFASIMLLLSMVVTAMVQFTLAVLRTRARNLLLGVASLVREARPEAEDCDRRGYRTVQKDKKDASKVLNSGETGTITRVKDPTDFVHYRLAGPKISWLGVETLKRAASDVSVEIGDEKTVDRRYPLVELSMQKRFLLHARLWSLFWAAMIAFSFQIDTPDLVARLSTDTEYRERVLAETDGLLVDAEESIQRFHDYESAAEIALVRLADEFPTARERIEEASGIGVNRDYIVEELELVLDGYPNANEVTTRYEEYLDSYATEAITDASRTAKQATQSLAMLDIHFWPDSNFYIAKSGTFRFSSLVGVLMSTILLMLGAPFWFNVLRKLVNFRDALQKKDATTDNGQGAKP